MLGRAATLLSLKEKETDKETLTKKEEISARIKLRKKEHRLRIKQYKESVDAMSPRAIAIRKKVAPPVPSRYL